jgi:hypothetical protein
VISNYCFRTSSEWIILYVLGASSLCCGLWLVAVDVVSWGICAWDYAAQKRPECSSTHATHGSTASANSNTAPTRTCFMTWFSAKVNCRPLLLTTSMEPNFSSTIFQTRSVVIPMSLGCVSVQRKIFTNLALYVTAKQMTYYEIFSVCVCVCVCVCLYASSVNCILSLYE